MNFFIKKDSTFPELEFLLTQKIMTEYNITDEMLQNVAVTFSMINAETGLYKIANVAANIQYKRLRPQYPENFLYALMYRFNLNDTKKAGRFLGEFVIDFLGNDSCGKIKLPVDGQINIMITDTITKTTVI